MDGGFTIKNSNQFLNNSNYLDQRSMNVTPPTAEKISGINGTVSPTQTSEPGKSFAATLSEAIKGVNELQKSSDKAAQDLATGRTDNVAEVMLAAEKADVALKVMVQVRNKIIDAYNEIMKMQV
ncbi:MAG: flagellar hook-basal body complex protein FliE [Bdellovibrionaceae bacterium]|nr:flagellar hook-basal body complex protein FliE [Pseudobdellovibrionaceae bacterium]